LHWTREGLVSGPPASRSDAPASDAFEAVWRTYYENIFNPARLNLKAMQKEMPKSYWKNMPETAALPALARSAGARVDAMVKAEARAAARRNPDKAVAAMAAQAPASIVELNRLICETPSFVPGGGRAVPGEGPLRAALAFVGEQPGDHEDLAGRPFVGPAGQLLGQALAEAGIDRRDAYLTNAVKHFKNAQRGKRRIHQTPTAGEIKHYRWWLDMEIDFVAPKLVVALGGSAALALGGKAVSVTRDRGPASFGARRGFVTVHPSYILRLPDEGLRREAWKAFVADLRQASELAAA